MAQMSGKPRKPRRQAPRGRYLGATVSTTMRLRQSVREHLEAWATRGRRSVSELAQELIEEGIRMRECPGIYFASEPAGRTAKIAGTGLGVWEVLRDYVGDKDTERLRQAFGHLSQSQITAALMYYGRYPEEIRREVEANAALTPEVLAQRFPGLVRVAPLG
jgi:uncharacterized protein (DUF433 family)